MKTLQRTIRSLAMSSLNSIKNLVLREKNNIHFHIGLYVKLCHVVATILNFREKKTQTLYKELSKEYSSKVRFQMVQ
jgi:hypothetical protein